MFFGWMFKGWLVIFLGKLLWFFEDGWWIIGWCLMIVWGILGEFSEEFVEGFVCECVVDCWRNSEGCWWCVECVLVNVCMIVCEGSTVFWWSVEGFFNVKRIVDASLMVFWWFVWGYWVNRWRNDCEFVGDFRWCFEVVVFLYLFGRF